MINIHDMYIKNDGSIGIDTEFAPFDDTGHRGWKELKDLIKEHDLSIKVPRGSVIECLESIAGKTPLELTITMEDRDKLVALYSHPKVTKDQECAEVILKALQDSEKIAPPILPPTDYSLIAYVDEFGSLKCKETKRYALSSGGTVRPFVIAEGKEYSVELRANGYSDAFTRPKVHYSSLKKEMTKVMHDITLEGTDTNLVLNITTDWKPDTKFIDGELVRHDYSWYRCKTEHQSGEQFDGDKFERTWNNSVEIIFRQYVNVDKPRGAPEVDENLLWEIFEKPAVNNITQKYPEKYQGNLETLEFMQEFTDDVRWFPVQREFIASMACADTGLIAAETGAGKSGMAIGLINCKAPGRTLLIAPKGTVDDGGSLDLAQWQREFNKFSPDTPVYTMSSEDDFRQLADANGGELPFGVFISWDYVMFKKDALEVEPDAWTKSTMEAKMRKRCGLPKWEIGDQYYSQNIGQISDGKVITEFKPEITHDEDGNVKVKKQGNLVRPKGGFKCIAMPCLATKLGNIWDMIVIDEAHLIKNPGSQITQAVTMMQAPYRFCLTATPIHNYAYDIFTLAGWLCVDDWWRGNRSNPRWPYTRQQMGKFRDRFLSKEVDHTQREINRTSKNQISTTKESPILSEPQSLLKQTGTFLGFVTKRQCNPDMVKCIIHDVRVEMSLEQHTMYKHWLNFDNIDAAGTQMVMKQMQYLRGVCSSPDEGKHATEYEATGMLMPSPFNHKIIAVIETTISCLSRGEQVTIVYYSKGQGRVLSELLSSASIKHSRISGETKNKNKESVDFIKQETQVMLLSIGCAQALSWDQCPNLIIASLDWSYGKFNQALGRVYRLNSKVDVNIYCILIKDTIEELVYDKLVRKEDAAMTVMHGKRVPRKTKTMEPSELLAEHLFDWKDHGGLLAEYDLEEKYWPILKNKLIDCRGVRL
jgi:hypothetical protein